jgi:CubicO group peptidase (beta-lactamase class C family)
MTCSTPDVLAAITDLAARHNLPHVFIAVAHGAGDAARVETFAVGAGDGATGDNGTAADTLFPVASVTKLATALALLRLAASGSLALDDALAVHVPEAKSAVDGVTLRSLLCHTSGLPDDVAPELARYAHGLTWERLAQACLATPLVRAPHSKVTYSNVGYGLLALVVERCSGLPFATALTGLVLDPLHVEGYLGVEPPRPPAPVAGKLGEHAGTDLEPFNSLFWRSLSMPWAGLVTTSAGALALVRAFAGEPPGFLPAELRQAATRDQTGGLAGGFTGWLEWEPCPWGLGPELLGHKAPHMVPESASPGSFGHSGYSGCLAWADPAASVAYAVLGGTRSFSGWQTFWRPIGAQLLAG